MANLYPKWEGIDFFGVFAVFFPTITGIFSGAAMSGDLTHPSSAIPKGTLGAITITSATYMSVAIFLGCTVLPYGLENPEIMGNRTQNQIVHGHNQTELSGLIDYYQVNSTQPYLIIYACSFFSDNEDILHLPTVHLCRHLCIFYLFCTGIFCCITEDISGPS